MKTLDAAIGRFGNDPFLSYLKFARIDALYEIPARRKETPALYEGFVREYPKHKLASQATYMAAFSAFGEQLYAKARELAEAYLSSGQTPLRRSFPICNTSPRSVTCWKHRMTPRHERRLRRCIARW